MTLEIIDIHPHIISTDTVKYPPTPLRGQQSDWSKERPMDFAQLLAEMDAAGVAKAAVVHSSTFYGFNNSYLADCVALAPDRLTGVCSIDTLAPDAIPTLEGWLARGMTGLRIFTGGATLATDASTLDDPKTFPIWEYCGANNISICVQTSAPGMAKVRWLLEKFPQTKLVLDHLGRPDLDDGPPYAKAQTLWDMAQFKNLYLKVTPRTFALSKKGASTPEAFFGTLVEKFGADRCAFGSNQPANEGTMLDLVNEGKACFASLSQADQAMIWAGTAKTLYPTLA